jgi:hypothetical protein
MALTTVWLIALVEIKSVSFAIIGSGMTRDGNHAVDRRQPNGSPRVAQRARAGVTGKSPLERRMRGGGRSDRRTCLSNKFPGNREINREFREIQPFAAIHASSQRAKSIACGQIPCAMEQGKFKWTSGKIKWTSGKISRRTEKFILPITDRLSTAAPPRLSVDPTHTSIRRAAPAAPDVLSRYPTVAGRCARPAHEGVLTCLSLLWRMKAVERIFGVTR